MYLDMSRLRELSENNFQSFVILKDSRQIKLNLAKKRFLGTLSKTIIEIENSRKHFCQINGFLKSSKCIEFVFINKLLYSASDLLKELSNEA